MEHLVAAGVRTVLAMGCGDGQLAAAAACSPLQLIDVESGLRATALPLATASVDAVVTVNLLGDLDRPAIREVRRVLRPGGLFVAGSAHPLDSIELVPFWRPPARSIGTKEVAAMILGVFGVVAADTWKSRSVTLPDRDAVRDYLWMRSFRRSRRSGSPTRSRCAGRCRCR
ncbi:class I SAM-dependent methyltransferase [Pseudonocardia adelaidensis]|uniref:class I SAM-dependent methyltransferase n=1 Tax=Pseudonocardia adelaidensis TaxID=648754 RepID=UPI0031F097FF